MGLLLRSHNYGEGSAREHAALQPRYLGCRVVVAKSFARIHEGNLKKQGVVPLTFVDEGDYGRVRGGDLVSLVGLREVLEAGGRGGDVRLVVRRGGGGGAVEEIPVRHSLSVDQCGFILAGSALNLLSKRAGGAGAADASRAS